MIRKIALIFLLLVPACSGTFAFIFIDPGTHAHLAALEGTTVTEGLYRAEEAARALDRAIRIYKKNVKQLKELQKTYKADLLRNDFLTSLRDFKGDPKKILGLLTNTRKMVQKYDPYGSDDYQAPGEIRASKDATDAMGEILDNVDDTTHLMRHPNPKRIYSYYDRMKSSYYDYSKLIAKNKGIKEKIVKKMNDVLKELDGAKTESETRKYKDEYDVLDRHLALLQDEESVAFRNIQALEGQKKIYQSEKGTAAENRADFVQRDYWKNAKCATQEDVIKHFKEIETKAPRWM